MAFDLKKIPVKNVLISVIVALICGFILTFLNVGGNSFLFGVAISALIGGYLTKDIDSALIVGGLSGFLVFIIGGLLCMLILPSQVESFSIGSMLMSMVITGALISGVVSLISGEL